MKENKIGQIKSWYNKHITVGIHKQIMFGILIKRRIVAIAIGPFTIIYDI